MGELKLWMLKGSIRARLLATTAPTLRLMRGIAVWHAHAQKHMGNPSYMGERRPAWVTGDGGGTDAPTLPACAQLYIIRSVACMACAVPSCGCHAGVMRVS